MTPAENEPGDSGCAVTREISVSLSPYVTAMTNLAAISAGLPNPLWKRWSDRIRQRLPNGIRERLADFAVLAGPLLPAFLVPLTHAGEIPLDAHLDRLAAVTADTVITDIAATFGSAVPNGWHHIAEAPRRWLDAYTGALTATRPVVEEMWTEAKPLLDHEVQRVGGALAYRRTEALYRDIADRIAARKGKTTVLDLDAGAACRVHLLPFVGYPGRSFATRTGPRVSCLGYPVPGIVRIASEPAATTHPDALTMVLGSQRARILHYLDTPATMTQLAATLATAPNTVSYHCSQLAAAGLVSRNRDGQSVRIERTDRGDALVSLLRP